MDTGSPEAGGHAPGRRGLTISPKVIGIAVILVAAVWFILVNRGRASIYLWVPKVSAPMWLVLGIAYLAGVVTGLLVIVRRGKKQKEPES
jgi:uncharacterized integral membrane protein